MKRVGKVVLLIVLLFIFKVTANAVTAPLCPTMDCSELQYGSDQFYTCGCDDGSTNDGMNSSGETRNPSMNSNATRRNSSNSDKRSGTIGDDDTNNVIKVTSKSCRSMLGDPRVPETTAYYIRFVFNIIKYVAIIILVVMSIMDFFSAIVAQDNDQVKKAFSKTIKRFVICLIIFFLPILIDLLLQIIDKQSLKKCI